MRRAIDLSGRSLSYLESAAQSNVPSTNVLLLLHAFPMNADMWQPQLDAVPPGWRFLAPDMRGFGLSDNDGVENASEEEPRAWSLSLDDYAKDSIALLDRLGIRRVVVAGLSMGGYVAFAMLRLAPERVAGFVLADTKAEADTDEAKKGRRGMAALADSSGVAPVVDQMVPQLLSEAARRERPEIEQRVRAIAAANSARGLRDAVVSMMNRPDSVDLLADIRCPALVVVGGSDAVTPPAGARQMQHLIPGARFETIGGAGHLSNMEQPAAFNGVLLRFLGDHEWN